MALRQAAVEAEIARLTAEGKDVREAIHAVGRRATTLPDTLPRSVSLQWPFPKKRQFSKGRSPPRPAANELKLKDDPPPVSF
jgi:hypothetical protein